MSSTFWLAQTFAVSTWLDSRVGNDATMVDRAPGVFTGASTELVREESAKLKNVMVIVTRFTAA